LTCVVCGEPLPLGGTHVCTPEAVRRFEAGIRQRDRQVEGMNRAELSYDEQLADGFDLLARIFHRGRQTLRAAEFAIEYDRI
jgi:hypothetical protein